MGYKPVAKQYVLTFEDYPGLEIRTAGASLDELDSVSGMNANLVHKDKEKRLELFKFFAGRIIEWDMDHPAVSKKAETYPACPTCGMLEDDSLPPAFESMLCLPMELAVTITIGWATTISRVSVPKGLSSPGGGNSGPPIPLPDGMTDEIMKRLDQLQSPMKLPEPNFT